MAHLRKKDGKRTVGDKQLGDGHRPARQPGGANSDSDMQQQQGGGNRGQPGGIPGRETKRDREDELGQHRRAPGRERDKQDR